MKKASTWILLLAIVLFICVAATSVAVMSRMGMYLPDDTGAIALIQEPIAEAPSTDTKTEETVAGNSSTDVQTPVHTTSTDKESSASVRTDDQDVSIPTKAPGFEAGDEQQVWGTNTRVEIFRVSYENDQAVVSVHSSDGDKVIAPGTQNSYVFKVKNTGNVALDYTVELNAYVTGSDLVLPITARVCRYDGKWIVGNVETFDNMTGLDNGADEGVLGAGKYAYYTLDWCWPFEGDDSVDTLFGNLSAEQDITFTIEILTTATESTNPDDDGGILPPGTSDNVQTYLLIPLIGAAVVGFLLFLFFRLRNRRDDDEDGEV
ncbi:MAG: hypothetical protein J6C26_08775 [Clostridia bacterium]|nr:hypothetical protein [Clostridia bacterium]